MNTNRKPARRDDESCSTALLLVDVINPMDFPSGEQLARHALPAAGRLHELKQRAHASRVPVIYANDNFGRWRSDLSSVVEQCLRSGCPGRPITELLEPGPDDYFVLKPKHSAFFGTTLDTLLRHLGVCKLVIGGFAGDICVLFTALDAYMRDLQVIVPEDCLASNTPEDNDLALEVMRKVVKADTRPSTEVRFEQEEMTAAR